MGKNYGYSVLFERFSTKFNVQIDHHINVAMIRYYHASVRSASSVVL